MSLHINSVTSELGGHRRPWWAQCACSTGGASRLQKSLLVTTFFPASSGSCDCLDPAELPTEEGEAAWLGEATGYNTPELGTFRLQHPNPRQGSC